jgi:putative ABC transport system ATP-binding protein
MLQAMSRDRGKTVIIVTHNAVLAEAADRVIRIKNGKIREITVNPNPLPISKVNW